MKFAFLHTAQIHVQTFNLLTQDLGVEVEHVVKPDLLKRAQTLGLNDVKNETITTLEALSSADAVICTCSTLGPIVGEFAKITPQVIRIDQPLMQKALEFAPNIAVAICLESTRQPTLELLQTCAEEAGVEIKPQVILCAAAWKYFEAGDQVQFANAIARQIKSEMSDEAGCIILAQASMRVAEPVLNHIGIPVISSPELAVKRAIHIANLKIANLQSNS